MKITIETDKKLTDGELLYYKDKKVKSIRIHELLPELEDIKDNIRYLIQFKDIHEEEIDKLKARDMVIAKSLYDNYVERGIIDENEEFDTKFNAFIFEDAELNEEDLDDDFLRILNKVRV